MAKRPKGFDPLASLFMTPGAEEEAEVLPVEGDETSAPSFPPILELTDPYFSAPEDGPQAPSPRRLGPRARHITSGDPDITAPEIASPRGRRRPVTMDPPAPPMATPASAPPDPPAPEIIDAIEESMAPELPAPPSLPEAVEPDPTPPLQSEDPAQSGAPADLDESAPVEVDSETLPDVEQAAAPPPLAEDPVVLARALARAAVAKAGPPRPSRQAAEAEPPPAPAPAEPPPEPAPTEPAEQPAPAEPARPLSRVEALSRRAKRIQSAGDVIQRAIQVEREQSKQAEARRRDAPQRLQVEEPADSSAPAPSQLVLQVQALIEEKLRGLGPLRVSNCMPIEDRDVLRALWRAHRARFGAIGMLDQVVGAAAVLDALDRVPEGDLAAAHVLTEASDYLVWIDLREGTPLAAFADARAYFVGRR